MNLKVGDMYQGGFIFLLNPDKMHGLIAAEQDQSNSASWWNGSFLNIGATDTTNGFANTTLIINAQGAGTYAAKICRDYRGGQYNDWFLPSKNELNLLYVQKLAVGGFKSGIYWSSSEYETGSAWVEDFELGHQHLDNTSDGANVHTRPIRAF
ncbi:MAG TPA: hypothetical protein VLC28_05530 [Flavitalea sp.]|nr:hypothetical protein [Flavitalea sp.]